MKNRIPAISSVALVVALLTGCGSTAERSPVHVGPTSVAELSVLSRGISIDYDPVKSNKELETKADLVLTGTVQTVEAGPQFGREGDALSDVSSVVVHVKASEVSKGTLKPGETAYVITLAADGVDRDTWNKALPVGTEVVVYAVGPQNPAAAPQGSGIDAIDASAGRPEGEPLYSPLPQGFVVATTGGGLYWPLIDEAQAGALTDTLPGGTVVGGVAD